ncbi:MAG: CDP-alcohol phosphatidyltransferase family protein [Muribaculaceae bacterium]|nr:CDP-alcohol phosphatidyltransferase family protein [Muribaculaceae bacterium]MDE6093790.1 CDP-alcohol phosphatidyltransferase family protein [Muribaculaceae bacterium]
MNFKELKENYRSTLKSSDTEETIDLCFYRPVGYMWALIAKKLGIHPNTITIASIFLGVGAGVMMYYNDLLINMLGMVLLVWANSYDSADGQLARMTKQYSQLGRILDGVAGDIWFAAIYVAICLREPHTSLFFNQYPWLIWVMAVSAGFCHGKQAAMADTYRQFHLLFVNGKSELDNSADLKKQLSETPKSQWFKRLTLTFYRGYTMQQEATSPSMQKLRREINQKWPDGNIPQWFRDEFRAASKPLMKFTNILTFNWRAITLFVSLLLQMPWLYFAAELTVFNFIMLYMIMRHERICRRFIKKIEEL